MSIQESPVYHWNLHGQLGLSIRNRVRLWRSVQTQRKLNSFDSDRYLSRNLDLTAQEPGLSVSHSALRIVVYTAIFGDYDSVPIVRTPDPTISYALFTDQPVSAPQPWEVRIVAPVFVDPQRNARRLKLLPHLLFPDFDVSVWVDANCELHDLTRERVLEMLDNADIALPPHEERDCLFREGEVIINHRVDSPGRVARQMATYRIQGMPERAGLHATMFLIRRHNTSVCIRFSNLWWREVSRYSKRDQLSFDFIRWITNIKVRTLNIRYTSNDIFIWGRMGTGGHLKKSRNVSEHLAVQVNHSDIPAPFMAAPYSETYDCWPLAFMKQLYALNSIVEDSGGLLEGNLCYFNNTPYFRYSPPDPRRGIRREIFLRSLTICRSVFEIGFNAGHSSLLALAHAPVHVTSIDIGAHAYTRPAAEYLKGIYGERFRYARLDSRDLFERAENLDLPAVDLVHIDGGHSNEVLANDILTVLTFCRVGTRILIDDVYVEGIKRIMNRLVAERLLCLYDDLYCVESACYLMLSKVTFQRRADLNKRVATLAVS